LDAYSTYVNRTRRLATSWRATQAPFSGPSAEKVRNEGGRKAKVLLVGSCPATRLGLKVALGGNRHVAVVGEAAGAEEALRLAREHQPGLVILDTDLDEPLGGLGLCKSLKEDLGQPPRILIYTAHNSREHVAAASLSGADGYVHKGTDCETLREAVGKICRGERLWYLGPEKADARTKLKARIEEAHLTPKEREIVSLLLERRTSLEIAEHLCLSRNTVKTHVSSVFRKLGIHSRQDLFKAESA
jgi:DNA-binding NarL/FixJ family response regulator